MKAVVIGSCLYVAVLALSALLVAPVISHAGAVPEGGGSGWLLAQVEPSVTPTPGPTSTLSPAIAAALTPAATRPPLIETGSGWSTPVSPASAPAAAALSTRSEPVDCAALNPPVVGFEVSRGQSPADAVDLLDDLAAAGYDLGTVDISSGPIPACVDVLIVQGLAHNSHLSPAYAPADGAMLKAWTSGGGGLMLLGDWGSFRAGTDELFKAYGYSQQGTGAVSDPTDFDPGQGGNIWVIYQTDNFSGHPILAGVNALELLASSWLTPTAQTVVTTDADAIPAGVAVAAAFKDGAGCVFLVTDTNWSTTVAERGYSRQDNGRVARQAVAWLNGCGTQSPPPTRTPTPAPTAARVYLPLLSKSVRPGFPVFVGNAIAKRPPVFKGEVFYTTSIQVPSPLPAGGRFYFSSAADRVSQVVVDDDLVVLLNGATIFVYHFSPGGQVPNHAIVEVSRATMEQLAGKTVVVEYRDVYGTLVEATEMWLIWTP